MKRITKLSVSIFCLLIFSQLIISQTTRKQLESQKAAIQKELKQINELLFKNKKQRAETFSDIEKLSLKIERKQEFIKLTNKQINLLNKDLQENQKKQDQLSRELSQVRSAYKELILQSYKARSGKNILMFVLSSETFFQAFKRTQYIKQYANYQKQQSEVIKQEAKQLQELNNDLLRQKKDKQKLISENKAAKAILDDELLAQKELIEEIQKNLVKFSAQIKVKQRESEKLDREIRKLIQEAIAASNAKAGKSNKIVTFALTPEQKKLAATFTANKGKLPWPVANGVVKLRFGTNPSPIDPKIKIKSNGVRIATNQAEPVRAVWEGTVQGVMTPRNGNNTIMIRHGNYITVYKNLSKFYVGKGDKVTTKQVIGEVLTNKVSGESILSFGIYKDSSIQNPSSWIYKLY